MEIGFLQRHLGLRYQPHFFFLNDPPPPEFSPLPLHAPLPTPQTSGRPPANPKVLNPIDSSATLPARIRRSAHEILRPYFCLIGHSSRRALSRLTLSGQLLRGRSEEHTSELQSQSNLVCRLLLE